MSGTGTRWNADILAQIYTACNNEHDYRSVRKDLLSRLAQNIVASLNEGQPALTALDNHQRQWVHFVSNVEATIKEQIKAMNLDWDQNRIRELGSKEYSKFRKSIVKDRSLTHEEEAERLRLLAMIRWVSRSDFDTLVKKLDEPMYKYWKQEISPEEFLVIQHQLSEREN